MWTDFFEEFCCDGWGPIIPYRILAASDGPCQRESMTGAEDDVESGNRPVTSAEMGMRAGIFLLPKRA